eukprot:scaffold4003_cov165-Amphora_coffeaeformis.AAC.16
MMTDSSSSGARRLTRSSARTNQTPINGTANIANGTNGVANNKDGTNEPAKDLRQNWQEALPPWHTAALIALLLAVFTARIPDCLASMDHIANQETLMHVIFPRILAVRQVALIRLLLGSVIMLDTIYAFFYGKWEQDTAYYYPYSRLRVVRGIRFRGYVYSGSLKSACMTLSSFTMWSWVVEGATFMMLGGMTLYLDTHPTDELSIWLYRAVMIGWEICAPASILVSAIVKYVLWPLALEQKNGPDNNNSNVLKHPLALLEHNWNVLSVLVEVALLGGLPIRYQDFGWAPLFGLVYVLYSYAMMNAWVSPDVGPQFIYPFLDSTMEWLTSVCLLALLGVLMLSFGIFYALDYFITEILQENVLAHVASVVVIGLCVCRFRD